MKLITYFFILSLYFVVTSANASPILRSEFSSNAVQIDFEGLPAGETAVNTGEFTIVNGVTYDFGGLYTPIDNIGFFGPGGDNLAISFIWNAPVSALGFDYFVEEGDLNLFLFDIALDNSLVLVDFQVLSTTTSGFLGLNTNVNNISLAIIGTTGDARNLAVDNIIYQKVPAPASIALLGLGLAAIGWMRRKP